MGQKVRKGGEGGNEGVVEREVREEEVMGTFKERSSWPSWYSSEKYEIWSISKID